MYFIKKKHSSHLLVEHNRVRNKSGLRWSEETRVVTHTTAAFFDERRRANMCVCVCVLVCNLNRPKNVRFSWVWVCVSWPTTTIGCNDKKDSGMFSLRVFVCVSVEQTSSIFVYTVEFRISILFRFQKRHVNGCVGAWVMLWDLFSCSFVLVIVVVVVVVVVVVTEFCFRSLLLVMKFLVFDFERVSVNVSKC